MSERLDWGAVSRVAECGRLMELLDTLPIARWSVQHARGHTLLHYACTGENVAAAVTLLSSKLGVNACDRFGRTPVHWAVHNGQVRVLEVLCAAGAALRATENADLTPLDMGLGNPRRSHQCIRVLLANGVRLSTVHEDHRHLIAPELVAFERGVLQCRSVVVTLLALKKQRHRDVLRALDRWVVREIAWACWATRVNKEWQPPNL